MRRMVWFPVLMGMLCLGSPASAQQTTDCLPASMQQPAVTHHQVQIGGRTLRYTATAGYMTIFEEVEPKPGEKTDALVRCKAHIFYIAYTLDGVRDPARRPITFSFNGGPGSSSVWLHLGALGPRRVAMTEEGWPLPPPYRLVNNEYSILDLTDLVFIDPVTTGYSRAVPGESDKQFHGFQADIESVGEFIRLYITRHQRWASPKFLIGESYGTTRAAGLVRYLQRRHGMYFNGVILVSAILNFQTARFDRGNDLPYILFLPTYTATAWYHKRLPPDLQADLKKTLAQVEAFALNEYARALLLGDDLPPDQEQHVVQQLARFTGLSPAYIRRTNLRIHIRRFVKELLRDRRRTVGRLDSRFTGIDYDAAGETFEYDPSYAAIQGPFTATLNHYVRHELKYENDLPYEILTSRVRPWRFETAENRYLNVAEDLRQALTQNPHLQVFIACGYYDLATPYFAARYTVQHMGLDPELRGNITFGYYEAGHMMYIHRPSLQQFKADLTAFFARAVAHRE